MAAIPRVLPTLLTVLQTHCTPPAVTAVVTASPVEIFHPYWQGCRGRCSLTLQLCFVVIIVSLHNAGGAAERPRHNES